MSWHTLSAARLSEQHFKQALALERPDYLANIEDRFCHAWKVVFEHPQAGKMQLSERFYSTYGEAEAVAAKAIDSHPTDSPFGPLLAYPQRVRTTPASVALGREEAA